MLETLYTNYFWPSTSSAHPDHAHFFVTFLTPSEFIHTERDIRHCIIANWRSQLNCTTSNFGHQQRSIEHTLVLFYLNESYSGDFQRLTAMSFFAQSYSHCISSLEFTVIFICLHSISAYGAIQSPLFPLESVLKKHLFLVSRSLSSVLAVGVWKVSVVHGMQNVDCSELMFHELRSLEAMFLELWSCIHLHTVLCIS